jgi:hypothetical protein
MYSEKRYFSLRSNMHRNREDIRIPMNGAISAVRAQELKQGIGDS